MKASVHPPARAQRLSPVQRSAERPAWSEPAPQAIDTSPAMLAQRMRIERAFGPAVKLPAPAPAQRRLAPGAGAVQLLPMQPVAQFGGWGSTLAWAAGGAALGAAVVGGGAAIGLGALGGLAAKGVYDWATQDPELPQHGLQPDEENEVEQGHDGDEEDGAEELDFPLAEPEDIDRGQDPDLYEQIEQLTLDFSRLSINDNVDEFQRSPVRGGTRNRGNSPFLFKRGPLQLKRGPGPSYQSYYKSSLHGSYSEVEYTRNGKGTFDFSKRPTVYKGGKWKNPVDAGSLVELSHGSKDKKYGITAGLRKVKLVDASRGVHFGIANRIKGYDAGNSSPDDWTWHHLPQPYKMVLVDRQVHRKHGHNGGKFLWT